jgi:RNA polymerase sigma-70 factor (ECF subfamily)
VVGDDWAVTELLEGKGGPVLNWSATGYRCEVGYRSTHLWALPPNLWVLSVIENLAQSSPTSTDPQILKEAELISRIVSGERELFYDLIRPCERAAFMTAFSVVKNEADAEEIVQEAVVKAYRALGSFRRESKFSTWLVQITLNEARMRLRKLRSKPETSLEDLADDPDGDYTPAILADWREIPSEALDRKELRELLQQAVSELPEKYREVLILRDVQEMNIAETAQLLGVTEGVVKTRLFRARLLMQKLVAPELLAQRKKDRKG